MTEKYQVVFCIVNAGYSDVVMDAAKEVGARGGTVIHARGTANKEAEKYFHITIQPDKDVVMILVPEKIKDAVLHALYRSAGLNTAGQGIAFAVAVDDVVGVSGEEIKPAAPTPADKHNKGEQPAQAEEIGGEQANAQIGQGEQPTQDGQSAQGEPKAEQVEQDKVSAQSEQDDEGGDK